MIINWKQTTTYDRNSNNEQQPITVTKEVDIKNKNNNIICNLWLLLFSTLISQGRLIKIEGWGPVSTNLGWGQVSSNWDRGRNGSEIRDPGQGAENINTRDIVVIRSCGTDFEFSAAFFLSYFDVKCLLSSWHACVYRQAREL